MTRIALGIILILAGFGGLLWCGCDEGGPPPDVQTRLSGEVRPEEVSPLPEDSSSPDKSSPDKPLPGGRFFPPTGGDPGLVQVDYSALTLRFPGPAGRYIVRVWAYEDFDAAAAEADRLRRSGLDAFVLPLEIGPDVWPQVCIGRWGRAAEAYAEADRLRRDGYIKIFRIMKLKGG